MVAADPKTPFTIPKLPIVYQRQKCHYYYLTLLQSTEMECRNNNQQTLVVVVVVVINLVEHLKTVE